jgi:hypothetical protein
MDEMRRSRGRHLRTDIQSHIFLEINNHKMVLNKKYVILHLDSGANRKHPRLEEKSNKGKPLDFICTIKFVLLSLRRFSV